MKVSKKVKEKLKLSEAKVAVPAPEGYHWMEESGRYYLMEGEYTPHPSAVEVANFRVVNHD